MCPRLGEEATGGLLDRETFEPQANYGAELMPAGPLHDQNRRYHSFMKDSGEDSDAAFQS